MDNAAEQKIKKALERLMAVQNGPPLIRDAQEWREAMTDCDAALALLTGLVDSYVATHNATNK